MKKIYFLIAIISFLIGLSIIYVFNDINFIRFYISDVVIIIFIFTFIKSFSSVRSGQLIVAIMIFAVLVEFAQKFKIADILKTEKGLVRTMIGTNFDWIDIVIYILTGIFVYIADKKLKSRFK